MLPFLFQIVLLVVLWLGRVALKPANSDLRRPGEGQWRSIEALVVFTTQLQTLIAVVTALGKFFGGILSLKWVHDCRGTWEWPFVGSRMHFFLPDTLAGWGTNLIANDICHVMYAFSVV